MELRDLDREGEHSLAQHQRSSRPQFRSSYQSFSSLLNANPSGSTLEDSGTSEDFDLLGDVSDSYGFTESETAFTNGDCFRLRAPSPSTVYSDRTVSLTWTNVRVTSRTLVESFFKRCRPKVVKESQLLRGVNGYAKPGNLLAIIGARGSGKTTLLKTLSFRTSSTIFIEGNRMVNGEPADTSVASLMAYIQEKDLFLPSLTVREHLQIQAYLRMKSDVSDREKSKKVHNMLIESELTEVSDHLIGYSPADGISMEIRKRLAIATELLTNPPALFHDEPTKGLDPVMAFNVVQELKDLASIGHTVVCSFETAPSQLYELFDSVMLLAEGRCVYFGARQSAVDFFSLAGHVCPQYYCPADYFRSILQVTPNAPVHCRERIETLCNSFDNSHFGWRAYEQRQDETFKARVRRSSSVRERINKKKKKIYTTDWCIQLTTLLWRHSIIIRRRLWLFQLHFLHILVISILIGATYFKISHTQTGIQGVVALFFIFIVFQSCDTLYSSIKHLQYELPLARSECKIGLYGVDTYLIARYLIEVPGSIVYPILSSSVVYWLAGLNPEGLRFLIFIGVVILVANAGSSFGLLLSVLTPSQTAKAIILAVFVLPILTLGGYFINIGTIPVFIQWLQYLSWFRYAFEALNINQWTGVEHIGNCRNDSRMPCLETSEQLFHQYHLDANNLVVDFVALIALCIGFQLLSLVILLVRKKQRTES